jgi:hypothetical protein
MSLDEWGNMLLNFTDTVFITYSIFQELNISLLYSNTFSMHFFPKALTEEKTR